MDHRTRAEIHHSQDPCVLPRFRIGNPRKCDPYPLHPPVLGAQPEIRVPSDGVVTEVHSREHPGQCAHAHPDLPLVPLEGELLTSDGGMQFR